MSITKRKRVKEGKKILDACCGGRMFWFNKKHPDALFVDIRKEKHFITRGNEGVNNRHRAILPDVVMDFRKLDLQDNQFSLVVFDPPHLKLGRKSYFAQIYGSLENTWQEDLRKGFAECFRVLKPTGVLIFKWNESDIPLREILALTPVEPLFGHRSGKASKTHWVAFMKSLPHKVKYKSMKITKEKVREFLRESNAIEGVYDEDSLKQAEIAWDYLIKQPVLHLGVVLKTHKILMLNQKGLHPDEKGYLRNIDVWIGGKKALHPILIQEQLEELLQGMLVSIDEDENKDDHVEYERIHPFVDGNGRTGRMFMNWHRVKKLKLPLLVIKDSEKQEYYKWFRE